MIGKHPGEKFPAASTARTAAGRVQSPAKTEHHLEWMPTSSLCDPVVPTHPRAGSKNHREEYLEYSSELAVLADAVQRP
jgi:hypothetical protein